jgi:hypothetical protein
MDVGSLKKRLQDHLTDGQVTIVGSGLSTAEGVPGMGGLANYLRTEVPKRIASGSKIVWDKIAAALAGGKDLESALLENAPDPALEAVIVELTAGLIGDAEATILTEVVSGPRQLRFSRLLTHMVKPKTGIPIVTTNYDRLIEVAAETAGLRTDTLFVGNHIGLLDSIGSKWALCCGVKKGKREVIREFAPFVKIFKPHGSLDWFLQGTRPVRCSMKLNDRPLIITPGLNKFRGGYDRPFDTHRDQGNREIDRAARFLIIGYGFNDDHLQTHLLPRANASQAS